MWLGQQIGVRVQKKNRVYRKTEYVIEVAFQIIGKEQIIQQKCIGEWTKVKYDLTANVKTWVGRPCLYPDSSQQAFVFKATFSLNTV